MRTTDPFGMCSRFVSGPYHQPTKSPLAAFVISWRQQFDKSAPLVRCSGRIADNKQSARRRLAIGNVHDGKLAASHVRCGVVIRDGLHNAARRYVVENLNPQGGHDALPQPVKIDAQRGEHGEMNAIGGLTEMLRVVHHDFDHGRPIADIVRPGGRRLYKPPLGGPHSIKRRGHLFVVVVAVAGRW
jgi:hypothetical protein